MKNRDFLFLLGRKIAQNRKNLGLSQEKLADKTGKIINTISNIERGVGDPKVSTLLDIAAALDTDLAALVDIDMKMNDNYKKSHEKIINEIVKTLQELDDKTLRIALRQIQALHE